MSKSFAAIIQKFACRFFVLSVFLSMQAALFDSTDLIHSYSRAEAFADGVLVDLSGNEVCRQHYRYPVAVTRAVYDIIDRAVKSPNHLNDFPGILHDILWMSRCNSKPLSESARVFDVVIKGAGRQAVYKMKIVCGPGDDLQPVVTIMLPEDD